MSSFVGCQPCMQLHAWPPAPSQKQAARHAPPPFGHQHPQMAGDTSARINTVTRGRQLMGAPCSVTRLAATSTPAKSKSAPGGSPATPARPTTRRGWKACTKLCMRTDKGLGYPKPSGTEIRRQACAFPGATRCPRDTYPHHRAQTPADRSGMPAISPGACLLELMPSRPLL